MDITLEVRNFINNQHLTISGSKSETNRLLIIQALYPTLKIVNASDSDDSQLMKKALTMIGKVKEIDIHHAGTAMRFLTSYLATLPHIDIHLTGSSRMKERPIKVLVDALKQLDADISYIEKEGFPPLHIKGKNITQKKVEISANVSSQYISSLMLIAPSLPNGLEINLKKTATSVPYLQMTWKMLNTLGIKGIFKDNKIIIPPTTHLRNNHFIVESDWSSASYFFSIIALTPIGSKVSLSHFHAESLQGDAILPEIYKDFGVQTTFQNTGVILEKTNHPTIQSIHLNLNQTPDIAQTIIVTCLGLGIQCKLTGLHTLKIKETDRLQALKNELKKFGAIIQITDNSIALKNSVNFTKSTINIATYDDHRMAMAFAPIAFKQPVCIHHAEVVTKSYPHFWRDLKRVGFLQKNK